MLKPYWVGQLIVMWFESNLTNLSSDFLHTQLPWLSFFLLQWVSLYSSSIVGSLWSEAACTDFHYVIVHVINCYIGVRSRKLRLEITSRLRRSVIGIDPHVCKEGPTPSGSLWRFFLFWALIFWKSGPSQYFRSCAQLSGDTQSGTLPNLRA